MGAHERPDVGGEHPQTRITAVGLFTLIQSMLVIAGAAVGIASISCSAYVTTQNPSWRAVHFYYFRADCSSNFNVKNITYLIQAINNASSRTEIILWVYIGLGITWLIGSVFLLVSAAKGKHIRPNKGKFLQITWIITTVFMLAYDGISTIIYFVDLTFVTNEDDLKDFLNIFPIRTIDFQTKGPPIIMGVLFAKGFLLWFIDGILIFVIWRQFVILQEMRHQHQWMQANVSTTPSYLLPPQVQQLGMKSTMPDTQSFPTLPRLMNLNGKLVGSNLSDAGQPHRPTALQKAARQGFNYGDPTSRPWSTPPMENPLSPRDSSYQGFSYGSPQNSYPQNGFPQESNGFYGGIRHSPAHRNRDRPASLQKGIDVFY